MPSSSFTPEFKQQAVIMVVDLSRPIVAVARELRVSPQTLHNWNAKYRRQHMGHEQQQTADENQKIKQLEKENRELRMENEFLKKVAHHNRGCSRWHNSPVVDGSEEAPGSTPPVAPRPLAFPEGVSSAGGAHVVQLIAGNGLGGGFGFDRTLVGQGP